MGGFTIHQPLNLLSFHACYDQRIRLQNRLFATLKSVNCMLVCIQHWLPYVSGTGFLPDVSMAKKRLAIASLVRRFQDYPSSTPTSKINPTTSKATGVDFTGTLYIREAVVQRKVYISLFTCATTRAVHLEVVTDITVQTFLLAYHRFAARKSVPQQMISA